MGVNTMHTLIEKVQKAATNEEGRVVPYVVAWFFGVPLFVLALIWLFNHH